MGLKIHVPLASRGIVSVWGEDARDFLQGLITNDIEKVSKNSAIYAALLTPQGKFLHDFFIVEYKDRLLLDCEAGRIPDLIKRLTMYRLRAKVDIADETGTFAVGVMLAPGQSGPDGNAGAAKTRFDGVSYIDPRHAGLGERTIRLIDEDDSFPADEAVLANNVAEYEAKRIALGIPDSAADLVPEKSMPLEVGFDELNGVDFQKGCYVGQEVTTRMKHRSLVRKRLFPVTFDGDLAPGTSVKAGDVVAGEIHSSQKGRGIALLRLDLVEQGGLSADGIALKAEKPDWAAF
ncbi:MAG: YgfZ/GcvT domain-containing protein [Alphaproteobacteria bacterium]